MTSVSRDVGVLITADLVVAGGQVLAPGWLDLDRGRVVALGSGVPPRPATQGLGPVTVVPGFVDIHVHGGGGATFAADPDDARTAVAQHRRHGTTTSLASLVTAPRDELPRLVAGAADLVDAGIVAGLHLEGPWLSQARCGAHRPDWLRDPEPAELEAVLAAGRGTIAMVTLAPERRGGLDAVRRLVDDGIVVAVGHTDGSYDQTRSAIDAGARVATHLFNAMRPIHHREPGPVVALLGDDRVVVEMIMDGVHVHPALYAGVVRQVGAERIALVTDAMAATGMPDGAYDLGSLGVTVTAGVARLTDGDSIAGSTATMDQIFRTALAALVSGGSGPDDGLLAAVRQTSATPARVLGRTGHDLSVGGVADLVVLDAQLQVTQVMQDGVWVDR
ncbi:MAG: N-acetylglucosamine-6-phosphate deacetylase [Nocardioidaceae bacterium]